MQDEGKNLSVVDEFGCPLLHCSFCIFFNYMGISDENHDGHIVGATKEVLFEVVKCFIDDVNNKCIANCVAKDNE